MTQNIFSMGYDELRYSRDSFSYVLFSFGKLMSFVIGYPLGIIVGTLAAGVVWFLNLFKNENRNSSVNHMDIEFCRPTFNKAEKILSQVSLDFSQQSNEYIELNAPSACGKDEMRTESKAPHIERGFNEKKERLLTRIAQLMEFIDKKIESIVSSCEYKKYELILNHYAHLQEQLRNEKSVAENATKFSHNNSHTEITANCLCGWKSTPGICPCCHSPTFIRQTTKINPVYIPDMEKRDNAKNNCESLSEMLLSIESEKSNPPDGYKNKKFLNSIIDKIRNLIGLIKTTTIELDLSPRMSAYKQMLHEVELFFIHDEDFIKDDYLPTSNNIYDFFKEMPASLPQTEQIHAKQGQPERTGFIKNNGRC